MLPSRREMMAYWFEHPIAGSIIAFGMVEGIKTLWESAVNPKGQSPFSSYSTIRSGDILDDLGHLSKSQQTELESIHGELKKASKMHASQASRIKQLGQVEEMQALIDNQNAHHDTHYEHHKALGSTSTTTSTSSAHGGNQRTPTGSTWDKLSAPGEKVQMFGMPKKKGTILMGPPSVRRRISLNSFTLGGLAQAPQKIETPKEDGLPATTHFGMIDMMPEQSDDATDNPWV